MRSSDCVEGANVSSRAVSIAGSLSEDLSPSNQEAETETLMRHGRHLLFLVSELLRLLISGSIVRKVGHDAEAASWEGNCEGAPIIECLAPKTTHSSLEIGCRPIRYKNLPPLTFYFNLQSQS